MATDLNLLLSATEPWAYRVECDAGYLRARSQAWRMNGSELQVFMFEGTRMTTAQGLYDELVRVLHLPGYFGNNFNALSECLTDVDVMKGSAFLLVIIDGDYVLRDAATEMLSGFIDVLQGSGEEWATTADIERPWHRFASPFHTIFHIGVGSCREELRRLPLLPTDSSSITES